MGGVKGYHLSLPGVWGSEAFFGVLLRCKFKTKMNPSRMFVKRFCLLCQIRRYNNVIYLFILTYTEYDSLHFLRKLTVNSFKQAEFHSFLLFQGN